MILVQIWISLVKEISVENLQSWKQNLCQALWNSFLKFLGIFWKKQRSFKFFKQETAGNPSFESFAGRSDQGADCKKRNLVQPLPGKGFFARRLHIPDVIHQQRHHMPRVEAVVKKNCLSALHEFQSDSPPLLFSSAFDRPWSVSLLPEKEKVFRGRKTVFKRKGGGGKKRNSCRRLHVTQLRLTARISRVGL